jgi:hypothetical protein
MKLMVANCTLYMVALKCGLVDDWPIADCVLEGPYIVAGRRNLIVIGKSTFAPCILRNNY